MRRRERWAALGGAILLTIALPIAIDQGYFRYNVYILPLLGLLAVLLYVAFFLTSPVFLSLVAGFRTTAGHKHQNAALVTFGVFIVSLVIGAFVWALRTSKQHITELRINDRATAPPAANSVRRAHLHVDSFEFLEVIPGKPMGVNIFYRNDGDADILDQHIYSLIARTAPASAPADAKLAEDYLWDKFINAPRQKPAGTHAAPAHSMGLWTTLYGEPLRASQIRWLKNGKFTIWFMGTAVYEDSAGEQATNFCTYYNGDPKVVFICSSHNGDVKLPQK